MDDAAGQAHDPQDHAHLGARNVDGTSLGADGAPTDTKTGQGHGGPQQRQGRARDGAKKRTHESNLKRSGKRSSKRTTEHPTVQYKRMSKNKREGEAQEAVTDPDDVYNVNDDVNDVDSDGELCCLEGDPGVNDVLLDDEVRPLPGQDDGDLMVDAVDTGGAENDDFEDIDGDGLLNDAPDVWHGLTDNTASPAPDPIHLGGPQQQQQRPQRRVRAPETQKLDSPQQQPHSLGLPEHTTGPAASSPSPHATAVGFRCGRPPTRQPAQRARSWWRAAVNVARRVVVNGARRLVSSALSRHRGNCVCSLQRLRRQPFFRLAFRSVLNILFNCAYSGNTAQNV